MTSPELQRYTAEFESLLGSMGIGIRQRRTLENGLQLELESGGVTCRVNLYYSTGKGFSVVPSGGDRKLLDSVTSAARSRPAGRSDRGWTGSDEAGKGDYLGPLVVCAVYCTPESAERMVRLGSADSKTLSDTKILSLSSTLKKELSDAWSPVVIEPGEYNRRFRELRSRGGNSVDMLAEAHGRAIAALLHRGYRPDRMVVDRFCSQPRLAPHLPPTDAALELRPGAEDDPAVATASVIARALYLESLSTLSAELGSPLVPGAGSVTDDAASRLVEIHGPEVLDRCAKVHFRNTGKVLSMELPDLT